MLLTGVGRHTIGCGLAFLRMMMLQPMNLQVTEEQQCEPYSVATDLPGSVSLDSVYMHDIVDTLPLPLAILSRSCAKSRLRDPRHQRMPISLLPKAYYG
jgi:hypothetical protein